LQSLKGSFLHEGRRHRQGGLAGLAAQWGLRLWDTVLLQSGSRVGGRI
jgi:hypothetical protein